MPELRHPPGTFDVLPDDSRPWEALVSIFARVAEAAGYGLVLTPTFEDLAVFQRIGESTDVVRKEMYDFKDKGGRHVALRPELTASVARAFIQHRPTTPWKAWYAGSNFRFERPQAGRYREFHQLGIEAFGSPDPLLDVEVIALAWEFYTAVGITRRELHINSLGDATCRPGYRAALLTYLTEHRAELCDEHRDRLEDNPLRILDCKKPECQAVVTGAPHQIDHLCDACQAHFDGVLAGLDTLAVPYTVDPLLVRGLDYYTRTAFEYVGVGLESAQNALGGGGRYDGLVAALGGPDTPAVGFALGIERILLAAGAEGLTDQLTATMGPRIEVFVVDLAGGRAALEMTARLRAAGTRADRAFDQRSAKAQFRAADRSGATLAVIVGPDELAAGKLTLKELAATGGDQVTVDAADLIEVARKHLRGR